MWEVLSAQVVLALLVHAAVATGWRSRHGRANSYRDFDNFVQSDLQITVYPTDQNVREGRDATFDCRARLADSGFNPEVRWSRVGGPLSPSAHESTGRLTINPVTLADSGRYVCSTTYNGQSKEAYVQLNVQSYGPQQLQGMLPTSGQCRADERACGNNECVKADYVCDGETDCRDRTDEKDCPTLRSCEPNEFRCNNGHCIQKMWVCDGDNDCDDKSDEMSCQHRPTTDGCGPTEFRCGDARQCVPLSFHCDGTNDCHDGSDEVGCVQPTIVEPPETNKQVQSGGTFQLSCRAVAVPEAYINWRLNWGPVCEPPRCVQHSEGGLGTLTVNNAQPLDQGAYTCEAINVKGRVLATPDCIVRIVSIPSPTLPPRPVQRCEQPGMTSQVSYSGMCQCKGLVTGPGCSQCVQGAFNLNDKAPQGCLKCFCFGITSQCRSSTWYRTKNTLLGEDKLTFNGDAQGVTLSDIDEEDIDYNADFEYVYPGMLTYSGAQYQTKYWRLPQRFLGNKVTAYGGGMAFELRYSCSGRLTNDPLVVIKGNKMTLVHKPRDSSEFVSDSTFKVSIDTYETNYEHADGRPATREDLMMVLADLDAFLIRATHCDGQHSTSVGDVSWEIAVDRDTQERLALEVEMCSCPPGYTGLSCEDCAPGYERSGHGPYLGTCVPERPRVQCSAAGAVSTQAQHGGRCQCKTYATGPLCDQCPPNSFYMAATNPHGCIPCFCSGVTQQCSSSSYYRTKVEIDYSRGDREQLDMSSADTHSPFRPTSRAVLTGRDITFSSFYEVPGQTLYWKMPEKFLGNKVTSYGGTLKYVFRYSGTGPLNTDYDVILRGNEVVLQYKNREMTYPDRDNVVEVKLFEDRWVRVDGQPATREHMIMTLADLDALLIKMNYLDECSSSSLISVSLEYAVPEPNGNRIAYEVEQCVCPPGYIGTSCEDCAPGYSRTGGGLYLGLCERCECNGHATECDKEHGFCLNCQHNTEGDHCERCKPGYEGDARRGTPHDCQVEATRPPCQCYNHSPRGCDSFGRCLFCEYHTQGYHCDECKKGYYGDATKGTPYDCTPCPCPGAADCYLDQYGQVKCRNCPAGYSGDRCDECAPGYSRSSTAEGRDCVPWGVVEEARREYVPSPEVPQPLRVEIDQPKNLQLSVGGRAHWYCRVIGHRGPELRLVWSKVGANTLPQGAKVKDGQLIIENVREEHAGQYRCTARGPHQFATDDARLDIVMITGHAPTMIVEPLELTVNENEPATFRCWVPGLSGCDLSWHKDHVGGSLPYGVYQNGGVLKIPRAKLEHAGNYICTAGNQYGLGQSQPVRLNVIRVPERPRVDPPELTVNVGEPARFRCWVPSNPSLTLEWKQQNGVPIPHGAQQIDGILNFPQSGREHTGSYVCTASDPDGRSPPQESNPVRLFVKAPPSQAPQVDPPRQSVNENGRAEFRCWVPGNPNAPLRWRRVDEAPLSYHVSDIQGVLTFARAQMSDAGDYICSMRDPETGRPLDSSPAHLDVMRPERPVVDPPEQTVDENGPARFRCFVPSNPGARLRWSKQGGAPLPYGASDTGEGMLYIPHAQASDAGEYVCSIVDPRGGPPTDSDPARLHVNRPLPTFRAPLVEPREQTVNEGDPSQIRCYVPGQPEARLEWRKHGGHLPHDATQRDGMLYLRRTTGADAGNYICSTEHPVDATPIDSPPARINVKPQARSPQVDPVEQTVNEGDPSQIRCTLPGYPDTRLQWRRLHGGLPSDSTQQDGVLYIPSTGRDDAGEYVCMAENPHGGPPLESPPARINVRQPFAPMVDPPEQTVNENETSRIHCYVPGNPSAALSWRREGGVLSHTARDDRGLLTIPETKLGDAGTYICSARDPSGAPSTDSQPARINVRRPEMSRAGGMPQIDPPEQDVYEDAPWRIRCWMPTDPTADLRWRKEDGELPPGAVDSDGILSVSHSQLSDTGSYVCSVHPVDEQDVDLTPVESLPARVNVRRKGRPQVDPQDQTVDENEPSQIRCWMPDDAAAELSWRREDGSPLPHGTVDEGRRLSIPRTTASSAGNYICSAKDPTGGPPIPSTSARIQVRKPKPMAPQVDPEEQTVRANDPSRIRCWVPGNPSAELSWRKRDGELPREATVDRGFLTIPRTQPSDAGEYICEAEDPDGGEPMDSRPARVSVKTPMSPQVDPPEQTVDENAMSRIRCWVPGKPDAQLQWRRKDGLPLPAGSQESGGVLTISRTQRNDAGDYICTATDPRDPHADRADSSPARVNVRPSSPAPVVDPLEQTVDEGQPTRFKCYVPGHPASRLHWSYRAPGYPLPAGAHDENGVLTIPKTSMEHAGDYICTFDAPEGPKESPTATLTVNRPVRPLEANPPRPVASPADQTVKVGEPARFHCDPNSDTPDYRIRWGHHTADGPLRGDVVEDADDLIISSADESNAGEYICTATNPHGSGESGPVRLHVTENEEPPTARVVPRVWNGRPGDRHQFKCITTGVPTPQITWTGPEGRELPEDVTDIGDGILEFSNGRSDLNGDYTCTAVNIVGEASDHGSVNIGPTLTIHTTPAGPRIALIVGEPLEIKCEAVGDPEPTVEWIHDWPPERGDLPDDYKPVQIADEYIRHPAIGLGNAGVYTCKGSNSHASATKDIYVEVVEASRVATVSILGGSTQWFEPGHPAELTCAATGTSLVDSLQWVKVDGTLPTDVEDHNEPGLLHFANFKSSDSGEYECRGYRNNDLVASSRVRVYPANAGPLDAARVEIDSPGVRVINQGDSLVLTCTVQGGENNGAHFKWALLRGGSLIRQFSTDSTLTIRKVDPTNDYGVYRCEVEDDDRKHLGYAYAAVTIGYDSPSKAQIVKFDERSDASLVCPVYAVPGAEVVWERQDGDMPPDSVSQRNKLLIKNFDDAATGVYICKVSVENQEIEGYIKAQIFVPDTIIQVLLESSSESINLGDRAWFDCKVTGDPDAEITWSKEGEDELPDNAIVTGNRLLFEDIREENGGIYKCRAKTKAGPLETRTVLNVGSAKRKRKHLSHHKKEAAHGRERRTEKKSHSVFGSWFASS